MTSVIASSVRFSKDSVMDEICNWNLSSQP